MVPQTSSGVPYTPPPVDGSLSDSQVSLGIIWSPPGLFILLVWEDARREHKCSINMGCELNERENTVISRRHAVYR